MEHNYFYSRSQSRMFGDAEVSFTSWYWDEQSITYPNAWDVVCCVHLHCVFIAVLFKLHEKKSQLLQHSPLLISYMKDTCERLLGLKNTKYSINMSQNWNSVLETWSYFGLLIHDQCHHSIEILTITTTTTASPEPKRDYVSQCYYIRCQTADKINKLHQRWAII